jgi:hypothetical protein
MLYCFFENDIRPLEIYLAEMSLGLKDVLGIACLDSCTGAQMPASCALWMSTII